MLTLALACFLSLQPHYPVCYPGKFNEVVRETKPLVRKKKVILGTFPDNPTIIKMLQEGPEQRKPHPLVKRDGVWVQE